MSGNPVCEHFKTAFERFGGRAVRLDRWGGEDLAGFPPSSFNVTSSSSIDLLHKVKRVPLLHFSLSQGPNLRQFPVARCRPESRNSHLTG